MKCRMTPNARGGSAVSIMSMVEVACEGWEEFEHDFEDGRCEGEEGFMDSEVTAFGAVGSTQYTVSIQFPLPAPTLFGSGPAAALEISVDPLFPEHREKHDDERSPLRVVLQRLWVQK